MGSFLLGIYAAETGSLQQSILIQHDNHYGFTKNILEGRRGNAQHGPVMQPMLLSLRSSKKYGAHHQI